MLIRYIIALGTLVQLVDIFIVCAIQGAELMSKHGINVPRGVAVGSVDEVKKALQDVFPNQSHVMRRMHNSYILSHT